MCHERATDREHLLLATGERACELFCALLEAREELVHAREVALDAAALLARVGPHQKVVEHDHPRKEAPALGRLADADPHDLVGLGLREVASVEADLPPGGMHESRDRPQRRRLSRTVGADERHNLAGAHRYGQAANRLHPAVEDVDLRDLQKRHG